MSGNDWEFAGQPGQNVGQGQDGVTRSDAGDGAGDLGPGSSAAAGGGANESLPGQVSGEGSQELDQLSERALELVGSVMDSRIASLRQDLEGHVERTVQSFSDKTAHRLSQQQRQQLQALDRAMDGLQDHLGPDFDQVRRQKQLEILLDTEAGEDAGDGDGQQTQTQPQRSQPPAGQSGDFAQVYLAQKLGDPSDWSEEEQTAIQRELSQARDMPTWMAAIERYATVRAGKQGGQGQGADNGAQGQGQGRRIARAQPVGGRTGGATQMTMEQLQAAYNRAAAARDMAELDRLGNLIDKATGS